MDTATEVTAPAASTSLTVQQRASLALGSSKHEAKLVALAAQSTAIVAITNPASYKELHSARMALKTERVNLEKEGKAARDDATKFSKAVIAEQARLIAIIQPEETRLDAIQSEYDNRIAAEKAAREKAEAERIAQIQAAIAELGAIPLKAVGKSALVIEQLMCDLDAAWEADAPIFQEFAGEAEAVKVECARQLSEVLAAAKFHEAEVEQARKDREELARMKAAEDKRQREAAEREAAEIRARAETDAKRRAEIAAEEAAANERIAAQARAAQAEIDRTAKEARERQAAEDARQQAERDRIAEQARQVEAAARAQREATEAAERLARAEQESRDRAAREAEEAEHRAAVAKQEEFERAERAKEQQEQEAREAEAREEKRKADELLDARAMLTAFRDRYGSLPEFAAVTRAIIQYFNPRETISTASGRAKKAAA